MITPHTGTFEISPRTNYSGPTRHVLIGLSVIFGEVLAKKGRVSSKFKIKKKELNYT